MDIESIKKIVDFFDEEISAESVNMTIPLPALLHRGLQKDVWEIGDKRDPLEYSDEFNLRMGKVLFNFVIKK